MNKLRSDSVFSQLTVEQVEILEGWLFEENLSYKEALERVQKEFNLQASLTGLRRFYRRLASERNKEDLLEMAGVCTEALKDCAADGKMHAGLVAMAVKLGLELAVQKPDRYREFTALLRAVTSAQGMEMRRVEFQREEERIARAVLWQQEEELRKKKEEEWRREWARQASERNEAREAKRKATIAAKRAARELRNAECGLRNSASTGTSAIHGNASDSSGSRGEKDNSAGNVSVEGNVITEEQRPIDDGRKNNEGPMGNDERMTNVQGPQGSAASAPEAERVEGNADEAEKSRETILKAEGANILALPEVAAGQPKKLSPEETALRGGCFRMIGQEKPRSAA